MKVQILGTRGEVDEFSSKHKKYSGILIDNILFDVGEKEYLDLKPKAIFVSHLHPDHAFWMKDTARVEDLPFYYHPGNVKALQSIRVDDLIVIPIPTIHSKKVESVAYLIEKRDLRVLYTSDMIWIKKKYHDQLRDLDLVITDGSFIKEGGMIRRDKKTGEVFGHCYSEDTEILTNKGWKLFKDLEASDKVATLEGEELKFVTPTSYHSEYYTGPMYHFANREIDLLVTPNHSMVVVEYFKRTKQGPIRVLQAKELAPLIKESKPWGIIKAPKEWKGTPFKNLDWFRFLGWYMAEGSSYIDKQDRGRTKIANQNPNYLDEIVELGKCLRRRPQRTPFGVIFYDKSLANFLKQFGHAKDKYIPRFILNSCKEGISAFLETYLKDDGHFEAGLYRCKTISKKLADDLQEAFLKLGYSTSIHVKQRPTSKGNKVYEVIATPRKRITRLRSPPKIVKYEGRVYCLEVPSHILLVRREGKVAFSGNSGVPNLVRLFKKLGAKRIVFTHFGTWMMKDPEKGKEQIRNYSNSIQVSAAEDGEIIDLKESTPLGITTIKEVEPIIPNVIARVQPKTGLYLVKPHAEMIMSGEKTLIIKTKKFTTHINEPLYLLQEKLCFGIITLKEPKEITLEEFKKLRDRHQITDKEAFELWGWRKEGPFYAYEFEIKENWKVPLPVSFPSGVQVFVSADKIKFLDLKALSILELLDLSESVLDDEFFADVAEELFNRNLFKNQTFQLIRGWIADYDPERPNDKQLADDYRIVLGWYSSLKAGKKLYKHVGEEKQEITLEDCKALGLKIFKEMIRRKFTFNPPETYKQYARELFEYLISQVGHNNVPFKKKEEKAKTIPDPAHIQIKDLEDIDNIFVARLSDTELLALHARLHEIEKELCKEQGKEIGKDECKITEPLMNAHIFTWTEMRKRKLKHSIETPLDRATSLEVVEYPEPEEGIPQQLFEDLPTKLKLEDVLKAFPETILVDNPIHVYLCGRIVNEQEIPSSHDLDLLFKQSWFHQPTVKAFLEQVSANNPEIAKRFHFVWDPEGPQIGYCYSPDTEVLTENGWKYIREVTLQDKVASLTDNSKITFVHPLQVLRFYYTGNMIQIKTKFIDLLVTPNHKLVVENRKTGKLQFIEAGRKITHHRIPRTGVWEGEEREYFEVPSYYNPSRRDSFRKLLPIPFETWAKLLGYYLSEGYIYRNKAIGICQSFGKKRDIMRQELTKLPFRLYEDKDGFKIYSVQLVSYFRQFGEAHEKFVPEEIKRSSPRIIKIFLDAIHLGNGTFPGNWRYSTVSKRLADDINELWFKVGVSSSVKHRIDRECYEVSSHEKFKKSYLKKKNYSEIPFEGFTYCLTVPSHIIYVRRNGKCCWCGNSMPLYRLAFLKVNQDEMKRSSPFEFLTEMQPRLFKPHIGMKAKAGLEKHEFWEPQELWENWGKKFIDRGIIVQKKYDGIRFQIHCKGNEIKIFTEDRQRDRASIFKKSVEEILQKKKVDSFIIDAEMVEYQCGKIQTKNLEVVCEPLDREQMIKWIAAKETKLDDENVVFHVHDCVFLNGETIADKGYEERWNAIDKIFSGLVHWSKIPGEKAEDMRSFLRLVKKYRSIRSSEGVVCKAADSTYKIKYSGESRTDEWCMPKGSKVMGNPGIYNIEDIKEGQLILGESGLQRVDKVWSSKYDGPIVTIKPYLLPPFSVTPEHRIPVYTSTFQTGEKRVLKQAKDITSSDSLILPHIARRMHRKIDKAFPGDPDIYYLLGWYLAEGYTDKYRVRINLGKDAADIIEKLALIAQKFGNAKIRHYPDHHTLSFGTSKDAQMFREQFGKNSYDKHVPLEVVLNNDRVLLRRFLEGYLEGNGNKHKYGYQFATHSPHLWFTLLFVCQKLGLVPSYHYSKDGMYHGFIPGSLEPQEGKVYHRRGHNIAIPIKEISVSHYEGLIYHLQTRSGFWLTPVLVHNSKLKNLKEIDVMVTKVIQKKTKEGKALNQYLYECVFSVPCTEIEKYREQDIVRQGGKCYLYIGRSYATGEKVGVGSIIVVRPIRIAEFKDAKGKLYYTWMFPYYDGRHPSKTEPDSIDVVKKLVAVSTGPLKLTEDEIVFRLPDCPFWKDENICSLKERFRSDSSELSMKVEYLKFPILCRFANHYKCKYVKSYYYGFKEFEVKNEVDEDTGEEINED